MLFPTPLSEVYSKEKYTLKTYESNFDALLFFNTYGKNSKDVKLYCDKLLEKEEYYIKVDQNGDCRFVY